LRNKEQETRLTLQQHDDDDDCDDDDDVLRITILRSVIIRTDTLSLGPS